jgi:hypothetical protein
MEVMPGMVVWDPRVAEAEIPGMVARRAVEAEAEMPGREVEVEEVVVMSMRYV